MNPLARKTTIQLIDDIDGTEADATVSFALDGVQYEVDLTDTHATELHNTITEWAEKGRRVAGRRTTRTKATTTDETRLIRAWAKDNGYTISDRGRVPASIQTAYQEAQR